MVCSANAAVFAHRLAITLEPPGPTAVNRYTFEPWRYFKTSTKPGVVCVRRSSDQARKAACSKQSASNTASFGMVFLVVISDLIETSTGISVLILPATHQIINKSGEHRFRPK